MTFMRKKVTGQCHGMSGGGEAPTYGGNPTLLEDNLGARQPWRTDLPLSFLGH